MNMEPSNSGEFRLAPGVELVPVDKLPAEIRERLDPEWGRFALIRPGTRTLPLLLDEEMATLVEEFRQPSSIPEALVRFSEQRNRDPQEVLKETFAFIKRLVGQRFLVDADQAAESTTGETAFDSGDWLEDFEIVRSLQRLEDMEVYQVRLGEGQFAALKISGSDTLSASSSRLAHEADILRWLAGNPTPKIIRTGEIEGRDYLLLEWRSGCDALIASEEWRLQGDSDSRRRLLDLARRILETYANLHRRGVIHGDISAGNILVDGQGRVTLIDFEDAGRAGPGAEGGTPRDRAGVSIYFEPEYARAFLAKQPPPPASVAGEQYALGALLYELIAGVPYLDFDLRWEVLMGQIVEEAPVAFADRGLPPWPPVEEVLGRALSKDPEQRFPSIEAMVAALVKAESAEPPRPAVSVSGDKFDELIELVTERAGDKGSWMAENIELPARASVYEGAAGVALGFHRMSRQLGDASLLELADIWIQRAAKAVERGGGDQEAGEASSLVGPAGVHLVESMIATALDQPDREQGALERSFECASREVGGLDLYEGSASRLLTLSHLLERWKNPQLVDRQRLLELGTQSLESLWIDLEGWPSITATVGDLGQAHGWAGFLHATLQWCRSAEVPLPDEARRRLKELSTQAVPMGRGLAWPWSLPLSETRGPRFSAGWCNGSAGCVFLWTTAVRALGEESFLELAEGAAWNAWESAQRDGSLCCGLVGRAYALLDLFQVTGQTLWLARARDLGMLAVREGVFEPGYPEGLFQGELGLALLAADLRHPDQAWFPLLTVEPELDSTTHWRRNGKGQDTRPDRPDQDG